MIELAGGRLSLGAPEHPSVGNRYAKPGAILQKGSAVHAPYVRRISAGCGM